MNKKKATEELHSHYRIFADSSFNALSLNFDVPNAMEYLKLEREIAIKKHILSPDITEKQIIASERFLKDELKKIGDYPLILYPMVLVYTISLFEIFLKHTIKILLTFNKNVLTENDRKIPLNLVLSFANYNELIDDLLEKFVHDLGYKSIKDQISFLNEKIKINLSFKKKNGLIENRRFIDTVGIQEIFLVRNLLLHNGGIINKQYKDLSKKTGAVEGEKIEISKEFLDKSLDILRHGANAILRQSNIYIKRYKSE